MRNVVAVMLALWGAAAWAAVSAVDSAGRRVSLPASAQRIVSVAPHVTELLFAAGAGSRVVAVSEYSDYPELAKRLPRVANSGAVNIEEVLALRADLVVAWRLDATARALDRLEALGIPVFYSEPHRLAEIPNAIEALGLLAGTEEAARATAQTLRGELEQTRLKYHGRPIVRVFYQISERPLMTVNGRHFISDAIALCGGRNIFADLPLIAPMIDAEAVMAADPEVIIAARRDAGDAAWQAFWLRFGQLRAVRNSNLVTLQQDQMHRHGPRAIAATGRLCEALDKARARSGLKAAIPR
jgi:iron complex transport system substrate-binding protein